MTKIQITKKLIDSATMEELKRLAIKLVEDNIHLREEIERIKTIRNKK